MEQRVNITLLSLFTFLCMNLQAQIFNVDREVKADSTYQPLSLIAGLNLSSDKQKKSVFDVSSSVELNKIFPNRYVLIGALKNDAVFNGKEVIQNEGLAHLRFRDQDSNQGQGLICAISFNLSVNIENLSLQIHAQKSK